MQEIWKDIKGYEGKYQISNLGHVKSIKKWCGNKNIEKYVSQEKAIKTFICNTGYSCVALWKNNKRNTHFIHRLIAIAFIPNPNNYLEINHKDYNPLNNDISNLEWCDRKYNVEYSKCHTAKHHICKTNTNEPYITKRKNNSYRITINKKEYYGGKTLEYAVLKRNQILKEVGLDGIINNSNK